MRQDEGRIGAVITAAGLSSRMGAFKPMLKISGKTFAELCISAFRSAGIEDIVVVTGHMANALEAHVVPLGAAVVRNAHYAENQMLDSVKLGLGRLAGSCGRAFITPVDAPAFSPDILKGLLAVMDSERCGAVLVRRGDKTGHPVLLSSGCISHVLSYNGEGGLRGAIKAFGLPVGYLDTDKSAVLLDADTPEDYRHMVETISNEHINNGEENFGWKT